MDAKQVADADMSMLVRLSRSLPHCGLRDLIEQAVGFEYDRRVDICSGGGLGKHFIKTSHTTPQINSDQSRPKLPGVYMVEVPHPITCHVEWHQCHWDGSKWRFIIQKGSGLAPNQDMRWFVEA